MRQTVIGFFENKDKANEARERLQANSFAERDIDVSVSHAGSYNDTATAAYDPTTDRTSNDSLRGSENTSNDDSAGDSIGRFFRNLFDNKEDAERYASAGRKHAILTVYVESHEEAQKAADILDTCGAVNVDERTRETAGHTQGNIDADRDDEDLQRRQGINAAGTDSALVIDEQLHAGKREVETGGVRLRSRIFERPVEETLRLREEHVRVERNKVDRPATESDFDTFREGEIEITETAEVPVVSKEARVVEEVRLTKDVEERDEVIRDTVRKTDVEVEQLNQDSDQASKRSKSKKSGL